MPNPTTLGQTRRLTVSHGFILIRLSRGMPVAGSIVNERTIETSILVRKQTVLSGAINPVCYDASSNGIKACVSTSGTQAHPVVSFVDSGRLGRVGGGIYRV